MAPVLLSTLSTIFSDGSCIIIYLIYYLGTYETEDPYPSLSDYHDYEPGLEFDDSELLDQKPDDEGKQLTPETEEWR